MDSNEDKGTWVQLKHDGQSRRGILTDDDFCAGGQTETSIGSVEAQCGFDRLHGEEGAIGYIALWLLGAPASILFIILLLRSCN